MPKFQTFIQNLSRFYVWEEQRKFVGRNMVIFLVQQVKKKIFLNFFKENKIEYIGATDILKGLISL